MSDIQKFGNITVIYDGVPQSLLSSVKSSMNTIFNDSQTADLLRGQTDSYTFRFAPLSNGANGFTSGNQGPNPTTTINTNLMSLNDSGNVILTNSYGVVKPFEVTAIHEITHVEFPDLSGDGPNGHDNAVGDYLFRTITINTANRLFGSHDTDENLYQSDDLAQANQDPNFSASGINLSNVKTADQAISLLRDPNSGIQKFLSPLAQDDQYDMGTSSYGDYIYKDEKSDGSTDETIYGSGNNFNIDNASIHENSGSSNNISGQNNFVSMTGNSGTYLGVFGSNNNISGDNGSNSINLGGDGTSATVSGTNGVGGYVGLCGNNESLTLANWGSTVQTASGVTGENISGSHESILLGGSAQANIYGDNNYFGFASSNSFAGVQGAGEIINNNDASNLVNINGNGSSATVNGDVSVGLYGSGQSVTLDNAGDHLTVYGGFTSEGINATGDTVALGGNSSANVYGSSDTIQLQANSGAYVGVFGQNQTVTGDTGSSTVNLGGDGTSATVSGGGYVGLCGSDETVNLDGGNFSIATASGVREETINGSGETINLPSDVHVTINGSGDTIYGLQGNDDVTINGAYNTFDGNSDEVDFEGNISSDRAGGDNDSYFDDGSYAGGTDGGGGYGYDPGDGGGDDWDDFDPLVLNLHGQAVQTVALDHSKAAFDIHGTGTQVKIGWGTPGEGYLVDLPAGKSAVTEDSDLVSSFAALRALDSNHDGHIDAHDAAWSDLKVWVDPTGHADPTQGSLVSLDQLGIASIDIDATPDRHSDNGNAILNDSTFTRTDGSTGAISGVAFRAASDGVHPASPLTILPPAAPASAPPSIATQASQLAAAMAAFGGASGSEAGLHTVPAAVQGTLTIDPSQTGHATQPLRHAA